MSTALYPPPVAGGFFMEKNRDFAFPGNPLEKSWKFGIIYG